MAQFEISKELENRAKPIIANHHNHLLHIPIIYVFRDKAQASKDGKLTWGDCKLKKGLQAMLALGVHDSDIPGVFIVTIARDIWDDHLDTAQQEALLDHELCHAWVERDATGAIKLSSRGHDIEEFGGVVKRHGIGWRDGLPEFLADIGKDQLELFAKNL